MCENQETSVAKLKPRQNSLGQHLRVKFHGQKNWPGEFCLGSNRRILSNSPLSKSSFSKGFSKENFVKFSFSQSWNLDKILWVNFDPEIWPGEFGPENFELSKKNSEERKPGPTKAWTQEISGTNLLIQFSWEIRQRCRGDGSRHRWKPRIKCNLKIWRTAGLDVNLCEKRERALVLDSNVVIYNQKEKAVMLSSR